MHFYPSNTVTDHENGWGEGRTRDGGARGRVFNIRNLQECFLTVVTSVLHR